MKTCVLYNGLSGNGTGEEKARAILKMWKDRDPVFTDITKLPSYEAFFADLTEDDILVLCGGDGTLNRFANDTLGISYPCPIYFAPTGTGNDFWRDITSGRDVVKEIEYREPIEITRYLSDLPVVSVKGKERRFINGIGYGIDGYCCEVADQIRASGNTDPINYSAIAIKGLLGKFSPRNAHAVVDGKEYDFKGVWIAPTMKGRFYGGGLMAAPDQDRMDLEGKVTLVIMGGAGRIPTLLAFSGVSKGTHVKKKMVKILPGNEITVTFDEPCALQIDGETVLDVKTYSVKAGK